jgi:hypothetical protein
VKTATGTASRHLNRRTAKPGRGKDRNSMDMTYALALGQARSCLAALADADRRGFDLESGHELLSVRV